MKQVKCLKEKFSLRMFSPQNRFFPSAVFWRNSVCDLLMLKLFFDDTTNGYYTLHRTSKYINTARPHRIVFRRFSSSCLG